MNRNRRRLSWLPATRHNSPPQTKVRRLDNPMKQVHCLLFSAVASVSFASAEDSNSPRTDGSRPEIAEIVGRIQKADYKGDRAGLQQLHEELAKFLANKEEAARVRYWLGFALWRRSINGFNEPTAPAELESDLNLAISEFRESAEADNKSVEARIGIISCLGFLMFMHKDDPSRVQELMQQMGPLTHELRAVAPDNPRLAWVLGGGYWFIGPERGGGQEKAIETYEHALPMARKEKSEATDPLTPSWGEAELWMSLAWSHLNRTTPDLAKAEECAHAALALVPNWHYVRDILLAQIGQAKAKSTSR